MTATTEAFEVRDRHGSFWMYRWQPCCGCGRSDCPRAQTEYRRVVCGHCKGRGCYLARFADNHFTLCSSCAGLGYVCEYRAAEPAASDVGGTS